MDGWWWLWVYLLSNWYTWPFIVAMYGLLIVCMLFPQLVTWLPHRLGY